MAREAELKIRVDATPTVAAVARPGDTVLIGFDRSLSDEELDQLLEDFTGFTETTGVHIGFVEQATSMVVARPDGGEPDVRTVQDRVEEIRGMADDVQAMRARIKDLNAELEDELGRPGSE